MEQENHGEGRWFREEKDNVSGWQYPQSGMLELVGASIEKLGLYYRFLRAFASMLLNSY